MVLLRLLAPLLLAVYVCASSSTPSPSGRGIPKVHVESYEVTHKTTGEALPPLDTVYLFDQLIDHDDPALGTFQQRYWVSSQYYQPGTLWLQSVHSAYMLMIRQVDRFSS